MNSIRQSWMPSRTIYRVISVALAFTVLASVVFLSPHRENYNIIPLFKTPPSANVAAIFDNRGDPRLVPIILHFASVLGPDWPIHLFTTEAFETRSKVFHRKVKDGSIQVRDLSSAAFSSHSEVSAFMTTPWLWEQLLPAKHVLLFQLDSIICSNSPFAIEDYLQYDLIGAPIQNARGWGLGFNGGLSLRNLEKTLEIVRNNDWVAEVKESKEKGLDGVPILPIGTSDINVVVPGHTNSPRIQYEDQWFFKKFMELPGANLPPLAVSRTFSVETMHYDTPFGYHKPHVTPEQKLPLNEYCPEWSMASTQHISDA